MDFALILLIALIITGVLWLLDKLFLAPGRLRRYEAAIADKGSDSKVVARPRVPILIEYARALFPVIASQRLRSATLFSSTNLSTDCGCR